MYSVPAVDRRIKLHTCLRHNVIKVVNFILAMLASAARRAEARTWEEGKTEYGLDSRV